MDRGTNFFANLSSDCSLFGKCALLMHILKLLWRRRQGPLQHPPKIHFPLYIWRRQRF